MKRHLKRHKVPKKWPIPRKGTKYVISANSHGKQGIPLVVVLRDVLKIVRNRKEVKKAVHQRNLLVNGKKVTDEKAGTTLFDTITLVPSKKNYRIILNERGKFGLEEIKDTEKGKKISKIINKKILKGKKIQLNLKDGNNFLFDSKASVGDSVLINFDKKKIDKVLEMKEGSNALVFAGKHTGKKGKIKKLKKERKMLELDHKEGKVNVLIKQVMVVE